jgi:Mrp family chromosome partitioning ATPase
MSSEKKVKEKKAEEVVKRILQLREEGEKREELKYVSKIRSPIIARFEKIKHKIAVMSGKGGVGKSTVATNLVAAFKAEGYNCGILDADVHGPNVPKMMGLDQKYPDFKGRTFYPLETEAGIKVWSVALYWPSDSTPVLWRGPYKTRVIKQFLAAVDWGELDYLIIDLPPGTGDEPQTIIEKIPELDGVVIVATPQEVALLDVRKSGEMVKEMGVPVLGVVENMSAKVICPHCGEILRCGNCGNEVEFFGEGGAEIASEELEVPFLGSIPVDPRIRTSGDEGTPFVLKYPDSDAAKDFREIVKRIEKEIEKHKSSEGE